MGGEPIVSRARAGARPFRYATQRIEIPASGHYFSQHRDERESRGVDRALWMADGADGSSANFGRRPDGQTLRNEFRGYQVQGWGAIAAV